MSEESKKGDSTTFNLRTDNTSGKIKTDWKTLGIIGSMLVGGCLFYSGVKTEFASMHKEFDWMRKQIAQKTTFDDLEKNNLRWKISNPTLTLPPPVTPSTGTSDAQNGKSATIPKAVPDHASN